MDKIFWIYLGQGVIVLFIIGLFMLYWERLKHMSKLGIDPMYTFKKPRNVLDEIDRVNEAKNNRRYV
tara:strand:- start:244 stop:444 length:201 start_codon:yes stop_codon:yes gene_type:complete